MHTPANVKGSIERLEFLCSFIPPLLEAMNKDEMNAIPEPEKWSKKQILGHLIDSAANNHHRFVRAQFEKSPTIFYDSDKWNAAGHYHKMSTESVVVFWRAYNAFLANLLRQIPEENYSRLCDTGGDQVTLGFVIVDYVVHLEHHLHQIVDYNK